MYKKKICVHNRPKQLTVLTTRINQTGKLVCQALLPELGAVG